MSQLDLVRSKKFSVINFAQLLREFETTPKEGLVKLRPQLNYLLKYLIQVKKKAAKLQRSAKSKQEAKNYTIWISIFNKLIPKVRRVL